jgi:hypothetical protein
MIDANDDKDKSGGDQTSHERCIKAAREYLKVAQSHVEEFARFVDSWDSAQKHSAGSQSPNERDGIQQAESLTPSDGSPQSSNSSATFVTAGDISESYSCASQTKEVNKFVAGHQKNTYIFKDQDLVSPIPKTSTREKTALGTRNQNRRLRQKSDIVNKPVHSLPEKEAQNLIRRSRRSKVTGENEPWLAFAPEGTSQDPRRSQTARPQKPIDEEFFDQHGRRISEQKMPWSTDFSAVTPSKRSNFPSSIVEDVFPEFRATNLLSSFNAGFVQAFPSMHFPVATSRPLGEVTNHRELSKPFEGVQFPAANENIEAYDNVMESQFHLGLGFDQEIQQDSDDPFVSSLTASAAPSMGFREATFNHTLGPSDFTGQSLWPKTPQRSSAFNPNMSYGSSFSEMTFRTTSDVLGIPSLGSTPLSSFSQGAAPVTPQDSAYTPTRKTSGQWQRLRNFHSPGIAQENLKDWSFEDLDIIT